MQKEKKDPQTPGFKLYLEYKQLLEEDPESIKINTSSKSVEDCYEELVKKIE